ncbi:hypothetical protein [Pseudomonas aeruginosa]|uniref:hypothetical protein n=1 Tax=Pseudomonas aeruginosa TaxID=287 RepID=UPI002113EB9D|nr:hypothetical protein [Pseudomonas aeruginosa]
MKANKDDAPEYLRRKRSQSFGKWSLAIALGLGLSGLALHMAENQFLAKPQAGQRSYSKIPTQTSNYKIPESEPKKTSEELFWESVNARNHQQSQPKQTIYNDSNYRPQKPVNTYTPPAPPSSSICAPANTATPNQSSKPRTNL